MDIVVSVVVMLYMLLGNLSRFIFLERFIPWTMDGLRFALQAFGTCDFSPFGYRVRVNYTADSFSFCKKEEFLYVDASLFRDINMMTLLIQIPRSI